MKILSYMMAANETTVKNFVLCMFACKRAMRALLRLCYYRLSLRWCGMLIVSGVEVTKNGFVCPVIVKGVISYGR